MTDSPVIEIDDVTKRYGEVTALDGVSLSVERGETFGLLGTNGAGKSTVFRLLIGHIAPDSGTLRVAGRNVATAGTDVRTAVGYLPERAGFPGDLTAREVVRFHARMRDLSNREGRIGGVLRRVGLAESADRPIAEFSKGMVRRLGLATALLPRPDILLLDEPTAGLDPLGIAAFHRIVRDLRDESDLTLVLSSHVLPEAESLCDSVGILHDGKLLASGPPGRLGERGETVRIRVRLADEAATDRIDDLAAEHDARVTGTRGSIIDVDCPSTTVPEVLASIVDTDVVDGYEVRETSLKRAFVEEIMADERENETRGDSSAAERRETGVSDDD